MGELLTLFCIGVALLVFGKFLGAVAWLSSDEAFVCYKKGSAETEQKEVNKCYLKTSQNSPT